MLIGGSLNGYAVNKAALNVSPQEYIGMDPSIASILLIGSMELQVSEAVLGDALALVTLSAAETGVTVSPGSDGVAAVSLDLLGDGTISSSSDGIAVIHLDAFGSPSSLKAVLLEETISIITVIGVVNPSNRPAIPSTFYPAFDKFMLPPRERLEAIPADDSTFQVDEGRSRLHVPEED